jgi:hypothetical protein
MPLGGLLRSRDSVPQNRSSVRRPPASTAAALTGLGTSQHVSISPSPAALRARLAHAEDYRERARRLGSAALHAWSLVPSVVERAQAAAIAPGRTEFRAARFCRRIIVPRSR